MKRRQPLDPESRRLRRREWARGVDLSTVGLVFPIAILLGIFGGRAIGSWLGARELGTWIGGGFGIAAGFYNLIKVALFLQREERRAKHPTEDEEREL
jgi:hypothetical protein